MLPETMFAMEKMAHNRVAGRQSQDDHRWETWHRPVSTISACFSGASCSGCAVAISSRNNDVKHTGLNSRIIQNSKHFPQVQKRR